MVGRRRPRALALGPALRSRGPASFLSNPTRDTITPLWAAPRAPRLAQAVPAPLPALG